MVPWPWPLAIVALSGLDRFTRKVSSFSLRESPTTTTVIPWPKSPGTKVSVPLVAT